MYALLSIDVYLTMYTCMHTYVYLQDNYVYMYT